MLRYFINTHKKHSYVSSMVSVSLAIVLLLIIANSYNNNQNIVNNEAIKLEEKRKIIDSQVEILNDSAKQELHQLYKSISLLENKTPEDIQALLTPLAYKHNNLVRYLWVNKLNSITLSSHTDFKSFRVDISKRDYIKQAQESPNTLIISPLLRHVNLPKDVFTMTIGLHNHKGEYTGAVMATIDATLLQVALEPLLNGCNCLFTLYAPHGEVIMQTTTTPEPAATQTKELKIHYNLSLDPAWIHRTQQEHITQALQWITLLLLLTGASFLLLRHRIIRPVSQALALIAPSAVAGHSPPAPSNSIEQLQHFASDYQHMQLRLKEQESIAAECGAIIKQLQSQQERFLKASSGEMNQMFDAIRHYAEHLEEMVLEQKIHPDAPYDFDDVREMGDNLKHLSQCFTTFSQQQAHKTEAADPGRILKQQLIELEPFMERRNIQLSITKEREVWIMQPAGGQLMHALTRAMLFTAIRFAEDESELKIHLSSLNERVILKLDVSSFRQSSLPTTEQDFGMFMTSMKRDMTEPIRNKISGHANVLIAEAAASQLHGDFRLEVPSGHNGFILYSQISVSV